jgi:HIV Tat-specific factor 1
LLKAKFEQKGEQFVPKKKAKKKKNKKLEKKLDQALGWGGFDDVLPAHLVTVVLKHMFSQSEFEEDPASKKDLEDDIRSECTKIGAWIRKSASRSGFGPARQ